MTPTDSSIPSAYDERERFRTATEAYVRRMGLLPPLPGEILQRHAEELRRELGARPGEERFLAVLIHNALWRPLLGSLPFTRRVLMLPQCLRSVGTCRGRADGLGLVCARCGGCPIGHLEALAEDLGYVSLVAEGTTVVTSLLADGRVDGVIGVGCLDVLERVFPYLVSQAIPGLAVPLLRNGCRETAVDLHWVEEVLRTEDGGGHSNWLEPRAFHCEVQSWFAPDALDESLGPPASMTEAIAREWLTAGGKRWRPLILAATYQSLASPSGAVEVPVHVRRLAVAVECFHKASLVHDDIEDEDERRYGRPTLPRQYGVPVALNVGDFLIGEGYRLIAHAEFPPDTRVAMLRIAAEGHRTLCLGQGEELAWRQASRMVTPAEVIAAYRKKTAPAFEVALRLGALAAGADEAVGSMLQRFSEALGAAYQIRDDLKDAETDLRSGHALPRPVLLSALAAEETRPRVDGPREGDLPLPGTSGSTKPDDPRERAVTRARDLLQHFHREAILSLEGLRYASLKLWLHRFAGRALRPYDPR